MLATQSAQHRPIYGRTGSFDIWHMAERFPDYDIYRLSFVFEPLNAIGIISPDRTGIQVSLGHVSPSAMMVKLERSGIVMDTNACVVDRTILFIPLDCIRPASNTTPAVNPNDVKADFRFASADLLDQVPEFVRNSPIKWIVKQAPVSCWPDMVKEHVSKDFVNGLKVLKQCFLRAMPSLRDDMVGCELLMLQGVPQLFIYFSKEDGTSLQDLARFTKEFITGKDGLEEQLLAVVKNADLITRWGESADRTSFYILSNSITHIKNLGQQFSKLTDYLTSRDRERVLAIWSGCPVNQHEST